MSNMYKQILAFISFLLTLVLFASYAPDVFRMFMMAAGGWYVGRFVGDLAREKWPADPKSVDK
jgi:hypothetical protein